MEQHKPDSSIFTHSPMTSSTHRHSAPLTHSSLAGEREREEGGGEGGAYLLQKVHFLIMVPFFFFFSFHFHLKSSLAGKSLNTTGCYHHHHHHGALEFFFFFSLRVLTIQCSELGPRENRSERIWIGGEKKKKGHRSLITVSGPVGFDMNFFFFFFSFFSENVQSDKSDVEQGFFFKEKTVPPPPSPRSGDDTVSRSRV
ncbi:hypothetical protein L873DRAFT_1147118 [Choiromyces venosus 120613-1]|uniref:Uncharacterized protein n=1 Tax=Choiromyces venosus 120613-1 TaxID=1336337 RepID=A0A3N4JJ56_9PEZI|nr:hypothetical protein L873DRAFT_1147118 [Choiromyces venosus 120613-1]